jgi:uncharacterized protein (DUF362 family)
MSLRRPRSRKRFMSRRTFIRFMLLTGIGGGILVDEVLSQPLGLIKWLRANSRRIINGFNESSQVAIVNADYKGDIASALRNAWEALSMPSLVSKRVVLVPQLVYSLNNREVNTNPLVVAAAIRILREKGAADVTVAAASPYYRDLTDMLYTGEGGGYMGVFEKQGVNFVDLNHDDVVKVPVKGEYSGRKFIWLPKTLKDADVIVSVPKMRTDQWLGVSVGLAGLANMLPGVVYGFPKNSYTVSGPETNLADLYETIPPQITIVDGVEGLEGDAPFFGRNRSTQVLVIGRDAVAVDATCTRIMGLEPGEKQVRHIWLLHWLGLGRYTLDKVEQKALPLQAVQQKYALATPIDLRALRF